MRTDEIYPRYTSTQDKEGNIEILQAPWRQRNDSFVDKKTCDSKGLKAITWLGSDGISGTGNAISVSYTEHQKEIPVYQRYA